MKPNGEFGGVTLRCLNTGGVTLPPGTEISAEDACSWPVANRRALSEGGTVRWHSVSNPFADRVEADIDLTAAPRRGRPAKAKE